MNELTDKILMNLNEPQLEAIKATEGYCRIIAGAGSGKTKTLSHRFAYLVNDLGIDPRNILCVTFTSKAAAEMRNRIKSLLGDGYDSALITTYHGFCVKVLKEDINTLFYPENFKILDVKEQKRILEDIYAEYSIKMDYNTFEKILEYIREEKVKNPDYIQLLTNPSYTFAPEWSEDLDGRIYQRYLETQKKLFGLDFNDLIYFTLYLFQHNQKVLNKWRTRLHYIQVDEFQDSSTKEVEIINFLCSGNDNLFVVGDPDQNIYEWRKSKNSFLVEFDKKYPDVKTIFLNQNYRSTPEILDVSNDLIDKNKNRIKKSLFTENDNGSKVEFYHCASETEEAEKIVKRVKSLQEKDYKLSDIAILYRASYVSRFVEQALYKNDIPYQIYGGTKFFDRSEIKDCLAFLRLLHENDDKSLLRIINTPHRGIGKPKILLMKNLQQQLKEKNIESPLFDILTFYADKQELANTGAKEFTEIIKSFRENKENLKISDLLNNLLDKLKYKPYIIQNGDMERFDNIVELINSIDSLEKSYGEKMSIGEYLQQVVLMADYESEKEKNSLKLMTIHASKGLEFPCVLIVGLTDGVFPSKRSLETRKDEGLEEERRLLYVALTRAKKELSLFESEGSENGSTLKLPSRFLFDINEKYISIIGKIGDEIKNLLTKQIQAFNGQEDTAKTKKNTGLSENKPPKLFKIGDKVIHSVFGSGEIIEVDNTHEAYLIKFSESKNPKPISIKFVGLKLDNSQKIWENEDVAPTEDITSAISSDETIYEVVPEKFEEIKKEENRKEDVAEIEFNVSLHGYQFPIIIDDNGDKNLWDSSAIPKIDWSCVDVYDLGKSVRNCGMCGKEGIRYLHIMRHDCGIIIGVDCICAGKMEGDIERANQRENELKNKINRFYTFLKSDLKKSAKGNLYTKYGDILITFMQTKYGENKWGFVAKDEFSNKFNTLEEAKFAAFMKYDR